MKVLIANKYFFRNGGSEVVMFQERDFLARSGQQVIDFSMQDKRNCESPFSAYFVGRQDFRDHGKRSRILSALALINSPEAVRNIRELIKDTRPSLVHCHNIYHHLTPSIIGAAKKLGIPVVLTLHDYKLVCPTYSRLRHGDPCSACLDGAFYNVIKSRCSDGSVGKSMLLYAEAVVQRWLGNYEMVDMFIAPSQFMLESITHRIPRDRVKLLYNGVDTEAIRGSGADDGYVLYMGRLSLEKGVETLMLAHEQSRVRWPLVVAGTGPLEDELKKQFKMVTFIGHVIGDRLRDIVNRAAVVVVPSEWYENCPMSVLEAMAYGKPVVGSRIGGIPELVADGETGLLFKAGNVLELRERLDVLMVDAGLRRKMGSQARKNVEREFTLHKHSAGLMGIYQSLIGVS